MRMTNTAPLALLLATTALVSTGCLKIPPYARPSAPVPQEFKEAVINGGGATLKLPPLSVFAATFEVT